MYGECMNYPAPSWLRILSSLCLSIILVIACYSNLQVYKQTRDMTEAWLMTQSIVDNVYRQCRRMPQQKIPTESFEFEPPLYKF